MAFLHTKNEFTSRMLSELRDSLAGHELVSWEAGRLAPANDIEILLASGGVCPLSKIDALSVSGNEADSDPGCTDIFIVEKEGSAFIKAVDQLYGKKVAARAVTLWLEAFDSLPSSGTVPRRVTIEAASRLAYDSVMEDHYSRRAKTRD